MFFLLVQRLIFLPVRENGEYKSGSSSWCILSFKMEQERLQDIENYLTVKQSAVVDWMEVGCLIHQMEADRLTCRMEADCRTCQREVDCLTRQRETDCLTCRREAV